MLKNIAVAAIGIWLLNVGQADAQGNISRARGNLITCPVNTCGKSGNAVAKDVKYCSAANCRKNGAK